ncbi:hypothetical protein TWF281_004096 [Arthrobotrys megalospora]
MASESEGTRANTGAASTALHQTPRKPHPLKLHTPSRLRFVTNADTPVDMFSPVKESPRTPVIRRKPAIISSPSPIQYPLYNGPYFSRVRRFQSRKMGIYEKIHEEWVRKALLKQAKNLQWDPETGEPLFKVAD